ncbi:MFS transporter [Nocardioides sp. JQ2195]|uniref:MFS transporter n=1 Tax=Nocardioides sp. JQ2195 TaxID=2592334 RepID=UPI00143EB20E|nr:MFS transporter [Nocardioides sp. JQ2195]QIX28409.1 MFS transporter [Nocardioides sp. JQ2195]
MAATGESLYGRLVHAEGDVDAGIDETARPHVARNGLRQMGGQAMQGIGDQVVNAKTVLPWLMATVGAPGVLLAFLVPVREAGSMLPQAAITPWVRRLRSRKWAWVAGAAAQAFGASGLALVALNLEGWPAGLAVIVALSVFAVGRALCSLASKDVLGRTVPKGQRGQINGVVTILSGAFALALGLGLELWGGDVGAGLLAALLLGAALAWVVGLVVYAGVHEPESTPDETDQRSGWAAQAWQLLRDDATFRRFVLVRALLLVSALSPPFVVAIGVANQGSSLSGLGLFVIAQGVANLIGGRIFGRLADKSSRLLMVWCAVAACALTTGFLLLLLVPAAKESSWLHPATYLLLALVHLGTRLGRKTYVVDMAEGDRRTEYVAVSNSAMGVLLLVAGALTAVLSIWGNVPALVLLVVLGVIGALLGRSLPEVSAR